MQSLVCGGCFWCSQYGASGSHGCCSRIAPNPSAPEINPQVSGTTRLNACPASAESASPWEGWQVRHKCAAGCALLYCGAHPGGERGEGQVHRLVLISDACHRFWRHKAPTFTLCRVMNLGNYHELGRKSYLTSFTTSKHRII